MSKIGPKRKYIVDENFFEVINTEAKAYILGFWFADGGVRDGSKKGIRKQIYLTQSIRDLEHVVLMRSLMGSNYPIQKRLNHNKKDWYVRLNITHPKIWADIIDKGCLPRKTFIIENPKNVPNSLIHHFIRGYFDGNGSVYFSNYAKRIQCKVTCGSSLFIAWLKLIINGGSIRKRFNKYELRIGVIKMYNYIYKDATIYLKRKKDIFDYFILKKEDSFVE